MTPTQLAKRVESPPRPPRQQKSFLEIYLGLRTSVMGNIASTEPERTISTGSEGAPPIFAFGAGATNSNQGDSTSNSSSHLGDSSVGGVTPPGKFSIRVLLESHVALQVLCSSHTFIVDSTFCS